MSAWSLEVRAGGDPGPAGTAALASALTALVESERPPAADPLPPVYRSRWRRAAMIEASDVPSHIKHDGPLWGVD